MIRVTIDLHLIGETENSYWLSNVTPNEVRDWMNDKILPLTFDEVRCKIREDDDFIMRIDKEEKNIRHAIEERIGRPCDIVQVLNKWPHRVDLSLEG